MKPEEYRATCYVAAASLSALAEHTNQGDEPLDKWEAAWMSLVILSFNYAVGEPEDDSGSGGSDFRVDGTLY